MASDLPPLEWFRVRDARDIKQLARFVRKRHVNTRSMPKADKRGNIVILLGWDSKPDSDWGRFQGSSAAVWFGDATLAEDGLRAVNLGLGWHAPDKTDIDHLRAEIERTASLTKDPTDAR